MRLIDADTLWRYWLRHKCGSVPVDYIRQQPTIFADPVRFGKWNAISKDSQGYSKLFECTVCRSVTYPPHPVQRCKYAYCPWCGAKMVGIMEDENDETD